jgi:hypothetical protein
MIATSSLLAMMCFHTSAFADPPPPTLSSSTLVETPDAASIVRPRIGGVEVPIFPNKPGSPGLFSEAGPWFYLSPVRVVKTSERPYDANTHTLSVCLETPFETAMVEDLYQAKKAVASFYKAREATNSGITAEAVTLQRIPLTGYDIAVVFSGTEIPIESRQPGDISIDFVNKPTFSSRPISDPDLKQRLATANATELQVRFRGYFRMRKYVVTKVSATAVESALQNVTESVKSGAKDGFIIVGDVNRDARSAIKSAVKASLRFEIEQSAQSTPETVAALKTLVSDALDKYFSQLKPLTTEEALQTGEHFLLWSNDIGRADLMPEHFRTLTKSLETANSFEQAWNRAFDYLNTTATESTDYQSFYNKLRDDLKTGGGANGSFLGILSAGFNFSLDNSFEKIDAGQKLEIEKLYNQLKTHMADTGSLKNSTYRRFTGEDYHTGATPKAIALYRVSSRDLAQQVEVSAVDIRWVGTASSASDFRFGLAAGADYFGDIRLGMMLPFFGNELPEGFVWADGKSKWPNEEWVPKEYRDSPVPNMQQMLVGGTTDFSADPKTKDVTWKDGRLAIPASGLVPVKDTVNPSIKTTDDRWGRFYPIGGEVPDYDTFKGFPRSDRDKRIRFSRPNGGDFAGVGGGFGMVPFPDSLPYHYSETTSIGGSASVQLNSPDQMPPHIRCRWIIRVK